MNGARLIEIFASKDKPVSDNEFLLIIDLIKNATTSELSQSPFSQVNIDALTKENLIFRVTEYPGCYDVIFGPQPTRQFIIPTSKTFSEFLNDYKKVCEGC